ncbi:MAG: hypothetical protein NTX09_13460 [Verrucomicrobia bacterium]|nr:hypothetical protein [Verrucomicrobiota bacterium]
MPVTVGGVEHEVTQAVEVGEGIVGEQLGNTGTGLLAEPQTAGAFERREKMCDLGTMRKQRSDVLQEAAAAGLIVEAARRAQGQPRIVGQTGALPKGSTSCGQSVERSQERRLQEERGRCHNGANFFLTSKARAKSQGA